MSGYRLRHGTDGRMLIERLAPVLVATFEDREAAAVALDALNGHLTPIVVGTDAAVTTEHPAATPEPEPEPDWSRLFDEIAAGGGVKIIAEREGIPFGTLRAKWGVEVKRRKVRDAAADDDGEDEPSDADIFEIALEAALTGPLTARQAADQYEVDYQELCAELRLRRGGSV